MIADGEGAQARSDQGAGEGFVVEVRGGGVSFGLPFAGADVVLKRNRKQPVLRGQGPRVFSP